MTSRFDVERAVMASGLSAPARLVMFVLCAMSDADTGIVPAQFTPSLTTLAARTGLDRSTVRRQLKALERAGWVIRIRPDIGKARKEKARTCYQVVIAEVGGTVPLAPSGVGGREPLGLGAEDTTARGTVPPNQSTPHVDQSKRDGSLSRKKNKKDLDQRIVATLLDVTGRTIPDSWVPNVRRAIFGGDGTPSPDIKDPAAYAEKAIRGEPNPVTRFLPSPEPPRLARPQPPEPAQPTPPSQPTPNGQPDEPTAPPMSREERQAFIAEARRQAREKREAKDAVRRPKPPSPPTQPPPAPDGDDTARERARQEAQMAVYTQALADGLSLEDALRKARAHGDGGQPHTPPEGPTP